MSSGEGFLRELLMLLNCCSTLLHCVTEIIFYFACVCVYIFTCLQVCSQLYNEIFFILTMKKILLNMYNLCVFTWSVCNFSVCYDNIYFFRFSFHVFTVTFLLFLIWTSISKLFFSLPFISCNHTTNLMKAFLSYPHSISNSILKGAVALLTKILTHRQHPVTSSLITDLQRIFQP